MVSPHVIIIIPTRGGKREWDEFGCLRPAEAPSIVRSRAQHEFAEPVRRGRHPLPPLRAAILLARQSRGEVEWKLFPRHQARVVVAHHGPATPQVSAATSVRGPSARKPKEPLNDLVEPASSHACHVVPSSQPVILSQPGRRGSAGLCWLTSPQGAWAGMDTSDEPVSARERGPRPWLITTLSAELQGPAPHRPPTEPTQTIHTKGTDCMHSNMQNRI